MQLWVTVSNPSQTHHAGHNQTRCISFLNTLPLQSLRIKSVTLDYSEDNFRLSLTLTLASMREFQEKIARSNIPVPHPELFPLTRYVTPAFSTVETTPWFNELMTLIIELAPNFTSNQAEIIQFINSIRADQTERVVVAPQGHSMDFSHHVDTAFLDDGAPREPDAIRTERELTALTRAVTLTAIRLTELTVLGGQVLNLIGGSRHIEQSVRALRNAEDDVDRAFQTALRASFFACAQPTIIALPSRGKNAKALSEIDGFDMNNIPENLCCPLSGEIMDQPVYDPEHPKYKFERAWIEQRLADKEENPFTRTSLTITALVNDTALKTDINYFMQYAHNQTFCGMKPGFLIGKSF